VEVRASPVDHGRTWVANFFQEKRSCAKKLDRFGADAYAKESSAPVSGLEMSGKKKDGLCRQGKARARDRINSNLTTSLNSEESIRWPNPCVGVRHNPNGSMSKLSRWVKGGRGGCVGGENRREEDQRRAHLSVKKEVDLKGRRPARSNLVFGTIVAGSDGGRSRAPDGVVP